MSEVDHSIAAHASRQHGAISRAQLLALGMSRRGIDARLRDARLNLLYRGVYLVGHEAAPPLTRPMAAVLACGDGAILSHRSSIELWELLRPTRHDPHVTVPGRLRSSRRGIVVHRTRPLDRSDYGTIERIPVTNVGRTLLDFAEIGIARELERAYDEALTQRLITRRQLEGVMERHPGRHGIRALAALIAKDVGPALTQSEAEERMLALIRAAGLPPPEVNVRIGRWQLDFLWRAERLNVEVDGHRYHSLEKAIGRNHARDADLEARGIRVRRVTAREILHSPEAVIARVARALSA